MDSLHVPGSKPRSSSEGRVGGRTLSRNEPPREYCVYTPIIVNSNQSEKGAIGKTNQSGINSETVIVNELLCYITQYRHSTTNSGLKAVCIRYFSDEDIAIAKGIIWSLADAHLSTFKPRNDSKLRSAAEADLNDLLDALVKIDGKVKLPTFAAVHIDKMPRFNPEDVDLFSLNERLNQLERKLEQHDDYIKEQQSDTQPRKMYSSVLKSTPKPNIHKVKAHEMPSMQGQGPSTVGAGSSSLTDNSPPVFGVDKEGFQIPKQHLKKLRSKESKNFVRGNASPAKIKGAAPTRDMFVSHLDRETTSKDLSDHIKEKGINVLDIEKMSNDKAILKSFKVKINRSDVDKILDPSIWPRGVLCRGFFYRKPRDSDQRIRVASGVSQVSSLGMSEINSLADFSGDISSDNSTYQ